MAHVWPAEFFTELILTIGLMAHFFICDAGFQTPSIHWGGFLGFTELCSLMRLH